MSSLRRPDESRFCYLRVCHQWRQGGIGRVPAIECQRGDDLRAGHAGMAEPKAVDNLSADREIDRVAHTFEQAWRRGEAPRLEDVFARHASLGTALRRELLAAELEYKLCAGDTLEWPVYRARFPDDAAYLDQLRQEFRDRFAPALSDTPKDGHCGRATESTIPYIPPQPPLAPLSLDDYALERRLGKGGQGEVHLARQRSLDRLVAVKLLLKSAGDEEPNVQRFLREARTLAQTHHPHIVTIHGLGRAAEGGYFLVMEYIAGDDLSRQIRQRAFAPDDAARIVVQIAGAIEHAHQRGVIHRDLKPSNVLWDEVRGPVVTDFGLAKDLRAADDLTLTEQVMGTPAFMAPEQAHRRFGEVSPRTDVYGLGATLFALLTGQGPYATGSIGEILQLLAGDGPLPDPREVKPETPSPLADICSRALARYPAERYDSAAALAEDLNRWLEGQPLAATPARNAVPRAPTPTSEGSNLLHTMWDQMDADLQDAFALAFNKKRRTGSTRISTQDLFQALARLGTGDVRRLLDALPQGAMPEPADPAIPTDRAVLREQPLLSDCVQESLTEFRKMPARPVKLAPTDLFVDVAKHGHGPSVVRLREHGVDPEAVERIVQQLGLKVLRRPAEQGPPRSDNPFIEQHPAREIIWDDNVQFSVYRPKAIWPEVWERLLVFAHVSELPPDAINGSDPVEEVRRQAEQVLGDRLPRFQSLSADSTQAVPREGELTLVPSGEGLEFNPPSRTFRWLEHVHREEFRFRAAAHLDGQLARGRLSVFLGSILIAEVNLVTRVDRQARQSPTASWDNHNRSHRFRRIYACVCHEDRSVAEQLRHYAEATRDSFLISQFEGRAAAFAQPQQQLIRSADVFQLYWSNRAMASSELEREWRFALSLGRAEFIRPLYWEEPFPRSQSLPTPELLALGFHKIPVLRQTSPADRADLPAAPPRATRSKRSRIAATHEAAAPFAAVPRSPPHVSDAFLEVLSGTQQGRILRLQRDRITIGRHAECDLVLSTSSVSRFHAQLVREERNWLVEDMQSPNGVYLNGTRVAGRTLLRDGDKLHLGDMVIAFRNPLAAPPVVPDAEVTATLAGSAPEPISSTAGERRIGAYRIAQTLARGGHGVLYKAYAPDGMMVVVRVFDHERWPDVLHSEGRRQLRHPGIVRMIEAGRHEGSPYGVYEFVDGPRLVELARHGPCVALRAAGVIQRAAVALHYAHQQGWGHGGLNPNEVLLAANDQPRLWSLQPMQPSAAPTLEMQMAVAPPFCAPEQVQDFVGCSVSADVYGLGATLYFLVTGRPPFTGDTAVDTLNNVVQQPAASPRTWNAAVGPQLEQIILTCLQKRPADRFPTAQGVADALGMHLTEGGVGSSPWWRSLRRALRME